MISKIETKKQQILEERRKRLINQGVSPDKVDDVIAREDYERLPANAKIERLETIIVQNAKSLASDVAELHTNQKILADALDVNFAAFARMLKELGMGEERQKQIVEEVEIELRALQERNEAEQKELLEKIKQAELQKQVDAPAPTGATPEVPEGATVFGG